jgi:hypothetical protein
MSVPDAALDERVDERVDQRVDRLRAAAARRVVEPDIEVVGQVGPGQVLADDQLSVHGLGLGLSAAQRRVLSREEVASIVQAGIRFEAVLEAGFAAQIATARRLDDPRLGFVLHEMGEETRHQRLFQRLAEQLQPEAELPVPFELMRLGYRVVIHASVRFPAFFYLLVLGGEEIPDLLQKRAAEDPATDAFIRDVNRYHRMEEARHLSFARAVYPEVWKAAGPVDRVLARHVAPRVIRAMFDTMVHPGVYRVAGLPWLSTWLRANRSAQRTQLRFDATRPVLETLVDAADLRRVPGAWRRLCGVDRVDRVVGPTANPPLGLASFVRSTAEFVTDVATLPVSAARAVAYAVS